MSTAETILIISSSPSSHFPNNTTTRRNEYITPSMDSSSAMRPVSGICQKFDIESRTVSGQDNALMDVQSASTFAVGSALDLNLPRPDTHRLNLEVNGTNMADEYAVLKSEILQESIAKGEINREEHSKRITTVCKPKKGTSEAEIIRDNGISSHLIAGPIEMQSLAQPTTKPKKARKLKVNLDPQTQLKKARVTKPWNIPTTELKAFVQPPTLTTPDPTPGMCLKSAIKTLPRNSLSQEGEPGALEPNSALKRREHWTPPTNGLPFCLGSESSDEMRRHNGRVPNKNQELPIAILPFSDLQGQYGFNNHTTRTPDKSRQRTAHGEPSIKRRCLDLAIPHASDRNSLVKTSANHIVAKRPVKKDLVAVVKKVKAPAKSTRTITGIAIANLQFKESANDEVIHELHPIFVDAPPIVNVIEKSNKNKKTTDVKSQRRKPRSKATLEGDKPSVKNKLKAKKKVLISVPKLLSPETAIRKIARQPLLFGTSSQIAREESPTFIRDLQNAMKESEDAMEEPMLSPWASVADRTFKLLISSRHLWTEGARKDDDSLLAMETNEERQNNSIPLEKDSSEYNAQKEFLDIDDIASFFTQSLDNQDFGKDELKLQAKGACSVPINDIQGEEKGIASIRPTHAVVESELTNLCVEAKSQNLLLRLPSTKHRPKMMLNCADISSSAKIELKSSNGLLTYNTVNTGKLPMTEDAQSGLPSEKKKRARKPAIATGQFETAEDGSTAKRLPKPRGRPRKDSNIFSPPPKQRGQAKGVKPVLPLSSRNSSGKLISKGLDVDDIEDSEPEPTSSPPRRRRVVHSPELELSHSQLLSNIQPVPDAAALQAHLFTQITNTIKTQPRTQNPTRPSWHEKMLMYDPIVLEDLTAWLNGGALKDFGGRETGPDIKATVVQKWCEEHSICCLWREGLRGGVKAKY